jgi:hypothetical protein
VFVHAKPAGGVGEAIGLGEGAWLGLGLGLGLGDATALGEGVGVGEGFEPVADPHAASRAIKPTASNNLRMPPCWSRKPRPTTGDRPASDEALAPREAGLAAQNSLATSSGWSRTIDCRRRRLTSPGVAPKTVTT